MESETFSVWINDEVRIDDLRLDLAKKHSGVLKSVFESPDSVGSRTIRRGEPVRIHLIGYDLDGERSESISETLLVSIFSVFRHGTACYPKAPSLEDYCHRLQVNALLKIEYDVRAHTADLLLNHDIEFIATAARGFRQYLPDDIEAMLRGLLAKSLKETYFCREIRPTVSVPCLMASGMIMRGTDQDTALRVAQEAIVADNADGSFYRWGGADVRLTSEPVSAGSIADTLRISDLAYVGFLFTAADGVCKPVGWVTVTIDPDIHGVTLDSKLSGDQTYQVATDSRLFLSPYCVKADNLYRDDDFVQKVYAALGTTLDDIRASVRRSPGTE